MTTVLRLGVLRAVGGKIEFTPAPAPPPVKVNEDAEFEVVWHYEEADRSRETFRVRLAIRGLGEPASVQAAVDDNPLGTEDAWGRLRIPVRVPVRGAIDVAWDLRAAYRSGSWTGATIDGNDFETAGTVVLDVR